MENYQLRVIEEKRELDIKRDNLQKFINSTTFDGLSSDTKSLILNQQGIMFSYSTCLTERIFDFEGES